MGALILEFGELIEMAKKKIKITFFENIFKKTNYFTICLQLLDTKYLQQFRELAKKTLIRNCNQNQ